MALTNFFFRENWVGSEVAGMKIAFFTIFDLIWIHIFAQKGLNKEFLKHTFNFISLRQKPEDRSHIITKFVTKIL